LINLVEAITERNLQKMQEEKSEQKLNREGILETTRVPW
jgi:hypothetical protein